MDQISIENLIIQLFILNFAKISVFQPVTKKSLKVVNNTPTIGLWRSLTCQNLNAGISLLILMTDLINIYALLPENVSFYWVFLTVLHLFYQRFQSPYGNHTKPFCGVFLRNYKYLWDISLRRLKGVTG